MNQPELGKLIGEIRNQKGITQKQLSEACNIDIRTVQRIECGEVVPRHTTLKLIAEFLDFDFQALTIPHSSQNNVSKDLLLISFIAGVLNIINWFFYVSIIPLQIDGVNLYLLGSVVHIVTTVIFITGFFILGRNFKSLMLQITAVIIIIIVPVMVVTNILGVYTQLDFLVYVIKLLGIILGINGIILGVSMLLIKNRYSVIWKISGIFQLLVNPFFIIPLTFINRIGFYLAVPSLIMFAMILFVEYRNSNSVVNNFNPVTESA